MCWVCYVINPSSFQEETHSLNGLLHFIIDRMPAIMHVQPSDVRLLVLYCLVLYCIVLYCIVPYNIHPITDYMPLLEIGLSLYFTLGEIRWSRVHAGDEPCRHHRGIHGMYGTVNMCICFSQHRAMPTKACLDARCINRPVPEYHWPCHLPTCIIVESPTSRDTDGSPPHDQGPLLKHRPARCCYQDQRIVLIHHPMPIPNIQPTNATVAKFLRSSTKRPLFLTYIRPQRAQPDLVGCALVCLI